MKTISLILASSVALISLNSNAGTDALYNIIEPESADIFVEGDAFENNVTTSDFVDLGAIMHNDELYGTENSSSTLSISSVVNKIENSPTAAGSTVQENAGEILNSDELH